MHEGFSPELVAAGGKSTISIPRPQSCGRQAAASRGKLGGAVGTLPLQGAQPGSCCAGEHEPGPAAEQATEP